MISAPLIEYLKKGIFTILGLMLAVYLFVILLTYTSNDPSWSHISSDMTTVNNTGGAMGAWLSDLLYSFFGFGSWWLLAFLVYESILIWWTNKPAFWVLRLVAYAFLILSGSAFIAQLFALLPHMATPEATGVKELAGGIIGSELQIRLAQLLTSWGNLLFLIVFVVITATFAFNIHWLVLYQKLTNLAWLGSGLKDDDNENAEGIATPVHNKRSKTQGGKDLILKKMMQRKANTGALAVEGRPEKDSPDTNDSDHNANQTVDTQKRFGGVLSDFLAKSGIKASVKATVAAETVCPVIDDDLESTPVAVAPPQKVSEANKPNKPNKPNPIKKAVANTSKVAVSTASSIVAPNRKAEPIRKVEPSFAWNDASIVKDLLAKDAVSEPHHTDLVPASTHSLASSDDVSTIVSTDTSAVAPHTQFDSLVLDTDTVSQTLANHDIEDDVEILSPSANLDALADAWLAEHGALSSIDALSLEDNLHHESIAPITKPTMVLADSSANAKNQSPRNTDSKDSAEVKAESEPLDVFAAMLSQTSIPENITPEAAAVNTVSSKTAISPEPSTNVTNVAKVSSTPVDMTPTNTPPANPTVNNNTVSAVAPMTAPKSEHNNTAVTAAKIQSESTTAIVESPKPTMRFDVPEGDSSNHITDMVPDDSGVDGESDAPIMPEIYDDAAFSKKSRSMQTAAYRAQLSPIPPLTILEKPDPNHQPSYTPDELEQLSELLEIKLQEFNVKAAVVNAIPGPVVTRFEVELAAGVKASKVTGISRDLARSLSMASLRVVEVIPGKPYIGIEVPNKQREMVRLIELLDTDKFKDRKSQISMAMGKDIGGKPIITDLARAPHMLVAGTTGSGKSVLVNAMLLSMLLKYTPDQLRLILIDPKQLELANYNDIPHLLTPVVTDMTEAASSLSWCVAEMERRYFLMSMLKVRKLSDFNKHVRAAEKAGNPMLDPLWRPNDSVSVSQAPKMKTLPMIVIVADEFADMIMQVGKPAEELITRLAQKSRAAGIHLVLATQRPSVDVITGLIKANIPVRAALRVNSKVDSRTILDSGGAEDMLGNGDMLFLGPGQIEPDRVHGAYVSDEEVNNVCDAWRERGAPDYIDNMAGNFELTSPSSGSGSPTGEDDDLYNEAVAFVMESRKVSASSIQRKFSIGYNRAARIVDSMEDAGLVSPMGKSGKRELLI